MPLTKQEFYDLFLVCLYWQSDLLSPLSCCTTVDKVARILNGLQLLDDKQKRKLQGDTALQQHFWSKSEVISGVSLEEAMGNTRKEILIRVSSERVIDPGRFNLARLLRDERIYLTLRGAKVVEVDLEKRYAEMLTIEQYFEEIRRQQDVFDALSEKAQLAIFKRYNERIRKET